MKKYLAEGLGTFAIVFFGTGAIIVNQETQGVISHVGIAITFGLIVMAMIYALGGISGAHCNPAVSVALAIIQKFSSKEVLPYLLSQLVGATFASLLLKFLFPQHLSLGTTIPHGTALQSLVLEFILTYFLMLVIMSFADSPKEKSAFAGLVIGSVVLLEALFAGPICGASMNPARSFGPALVSLQLHSLWIYWLAPIMGAIGAALTWKYLMR
ncbi:MAG: MIP family channel protein [Spirosomataceae bacterium]|mgnify:CR=1 FL=1